MNPIEELKEEHEAVLFSLRILERILLKIEHTGRVPDPAHLNGLFEFFGVFVDKCHHGKEEELLFPALEQAGISRDGGPIGVMLHEHQQGRDLVAKMKADLAGAVKKESGAAKGLISHGRDYIELLNQHIGKENQVLFPMAGRLLADKKVAQLEQGFETIEEEKIGEGKHEEFHRLLDALERIYVE